MSRVAPASAPFVVWEGLEVRLGSFRLGPLSGRLGPGLWRVPGPNGSGKTTFFRLLCGALRPDAGAVHLPRGRPDRDPAARADIAWIPAVPDAPELFTAGELWRIAAGLRRAPAWDGDRLLAEIGLDPALRLSEGSAGQRKKAELVAGLAGDPPVLLLDEAFAPLDVAARAVLAGWLDAWRTDRVVLLADHGEVPVRVDGTVSLAG